VPSGGQQRELGEVQFWCELLLLQRGDQHGIHGAGELAESPASCLGVMRVEVGEKGIISQVP